MNERELGIDRRQIRLFLSALFDGVAAGALVELRFRNGSGMGQFFCPVEQLLRAEGRIAELARTTDVFVGVIARRRRSGGRGDLVEEASVLWADCDDATAVEALGRVPTPSMVVASGSGSNRHAYWFLREPLAIDELVAANRRLAMALGADLASTDAARILRPAGSRNFKFRPPIPVRLLVVDGRARHELARVVAELPALDGAPSLRAPATRSVNGEALLEVPGPVWVERLTGQQPNRGDKIRCPFHVDEEPSLHVFAEPERGWFCFGCRRGGSVFDFAALLWGLEPRGRAFLELRRELERVLGAPGPPAKVGPDAA